MREGKRWGLQQRTFPLTPRPGDTGVSFPDTNIVRTFGRGGGGMVPSRPLLKDPPPGGGGAGQPRPFCVFSPLFAYFVCFLRQY